LPQIPGIPHSRMPQIRGVPHSWPLRHSQTLEFLRRCRLQVGMKNNVSWELSPAIVARHFFKNLGVFVPPHALRLPPEPIRTWGQFWCDVTVRDRDREGTGMG
ncbi:RM09 protein, partial [Anthoscopus minutus]|nr:RM09 protein [Anthoscopus minutus]